MHLAPMCQNITSTYPCHDHFGIISPWEVVLLFIILVALFVFGTVSIHRSNKWAKKP